MIKYLVIMAVAANSYAFEITTNHMIILGRSDFAHSQLVSKPSPSCLETITTAKFSQMAVGGKELASALESLPAVKTLVFWGTTVENLRASELTEELLNRIVEANVFMGTFTENALKVLLRSKSLTTFTQGQNIGAENDDSLGVFKNNNTIQALELSGHYTGKFFETLSTMPRLKRVFIETWKSINEANLDGYKRSHPEVFIEVTHMGQ